MEQYKTVLTSKKQISQDTWQFRFTLKNPHIIQFKAGQYIMVKVPADFVRDFAERYVNPPLTVRGVMSSGEVTRQYSICSAPTIRDSFELIIQIVPLGIASTYFASLHEGDVVEFQGPAGVFTLRENSLDKVMLATATGIAPIRSMLWDALPKKNVISKFILFWGLRRSSDVYYLEEFRTLTETHSNFSFRICLSRQESFDGLDNQCFGFGRIDKHLVNFLDPDISYLLEQRETIMEYHNKFEYYICGSDAVVESMRDFVSALGVEKQNIIFEKFV